MQQVGGVQGSQERLWCLAIFRSPFLVGQQQLKPDKHMHKHTSVCMNACTHTTSHLHGTQWCWECDVHLDSSARRLVLLSLHQSYSASLAVQETKPEETDRQSSQSDRRKAIKHRWWPPSDASCISLNSISNSRKHLRNRNHERLALDTSSKVSYFTQYITIKVLCRLNHVHWLNSFQTVSSELISNMHHVPTFV